MPVTAKAALHAMSSNMGNLIQMYMIARQYKFQDEENQRAQDAHEQLLDLREKAEVRDADLHPYKQEELAARIESSVQSAGRDEKYGVYLSELARGAKDENDEKSRQFDRQVNLDIEKDKLIGLMGQLSNPVKANSDTYEKTIKQIRTLIAQQRAAVGDYSDFDTKPVSDQAQLAILNFGLSVPVEARAELIATVDENPQATLSELVSAILRNPDISIDLKTSAQEVQSTFEEIEKMWVDRLNKAYKDADVNELPEGARGIIVKGEYIQVGPDEDEFTELLRDFFTRRDNIAILELGRAGIVPDYYDPKWESIGIINMSPIFQQEWFANSPEEVAKRKQEEAKRLKDEVFREEEDRKVRGIEETKRRSKVGRTLEDIYEKELGGLF